jgi:lipopolysaccharide biosynthesis protein
VQPARVLAFYLPQYFPIPENDEWWGPGFTEWTNVASAKPLFRGHKQPQLPGALGFYDLRVPETRAQQAKLARDHGVEAFCYWHYWFAGRRILNQVFDEVLETGSPDQSFALGWANQSWTGIWHGAENRMLIEQTYPGESDHRLHFEYLLNAFRDDRYFRVDGKPLLYLYHPEMIPRVQDVMQFWRDLARRAGLPGLYLVGEHRSFEPVTESLPAAMGLDALTPVRLPSRLRRSRNPAKWLHRRVNGSRLVGGRGPTLRDYGRAAAEFVVSASSRPDVHPCVIPNWDNTPRSGRRGLILTGSSPSGFAREVAAAASAIQHKPLEQRLLFVKSWNEWAEGNYLEPDRLNGVQWLEALRMGLTGKAP